MSNFAPDAHPVFTPEELYRICLDIQGMDIAEAMEYGRAHGLKKCYITSIRTLLGSAPSRGERITDEGVEAIKADAAAGMTIPEIARKYNRSYYTVFAYMKRHGIEAGQVNRFEWTEIKMRSLVNLSMKGWSLGEMAAKIGATKDCVRLKLSRIRKGNPKWFMPIATKMGFFKEVKNG